MFKKTVLAVTLIEIFIISLLVYKIYKKNSGPPVVNANIINKEETLSSQSSKLKYYYEYPPGIREDTDSWLTEKITHTVNSDTLNDGSEYEILKNPENFRIIALGDSFVEGLHVNTRDSWPEQMEIMLNTDNDCQNIAKFEVLNLGVGGFDIQNSVERYRIRGAKYNPDLVIWMLNETDFDVIREKTEPIVIKLTEKLKKEGILKENDDPSWDPVYYMAMDEFKKNYPKDKLMNAQDNFFQEINKYYQGRLLLVTFPFVIDEYKNQIKKWVHSRPETFYFDNLPDIYKQKLTLADGHPDQQAYKIIAERIKTYLENPIITDCKK